MKNRILEVLVVVLAAFSALIWHNVLTYDQPVPVAQENFGAPAFPAIAGPDAESIGLPVRIRIPSIALDAAIEEVALTTDGAMDVPKDPLDTGWYALGPRPGETGSAAIAGHVDWKYGASAVFTDLHKVKPGDKIMVQDDTGADIFFVVRESRKYDAAADALDVFSSNDGKAHLNIITCDGVWDTHAKQYEKRLVVFADREME